MLLGVGVEAADCDCVGEVVGDGVWTCVLLRDGVVLADGDCVIEEVTA